MSKSILITEDNKNSAKMITEIIASIAPSVEVFWADNCELAYKYAMEKDIDVFIIDIILNTSVRGDTSGIKFAEQIRGIEKYAFTPYIFMTSLEDPAWFAFRELHCYGYLEKPVDVEKAKELIRGALRFENRKCTDETVYFRKDKVIYPVKLSEIVYTQNENHVMIVYHKNGTTLRVPNKPCAQFLRELRTDGMLQCNRNTLVNKTYIKSVDLVNRYITMTNQNRLEIGGRFVKTVERGLK